MKIKIQIANWFLIFIRNSSFSVFSVAFIACSLIFSKSYGYWQKASVSQRFFDSTDDVIFNRHVSRVQSYHIRESIKFLQYPCFVERESFEDTGNKLHQEFKISLTPNPSRNNFRLYISSSTLQKAMVNILDELGKNIQSFQTNTNHELFIGKDWKSGIYFAEITIGKNQHLIKIEKFN